MANTPIGGPDAGGPDTGGPDAGGPPPSPVNGWILLDPQTVSASIDAAARFSVNHIQLSHDLIMNIEDVLGGDPATQARVDTLNAAIAQAHGHGMKAYIWAHEFSGLGFDVCYDPASADWEKRETAYRDGIARIPEVDGVILMFGSAPNPPWATLCTCAFCQTEYANNTLFERPPNDEKIRMITEKVGGAIVNDLHKELVARTFVHEPQENAWHEHGFASAEGVDFVAMHKSEVQDWEPYNPPDPVFGATGHWGFMEADAAGEYYGLSALPFCAPEYFAFRMRYMWDHAGIGVAARIERGSQSALGTPNEINLYAMSELVKDRHKPAEAIWREFLESFYGVAPQSAEQQLLEAILKNTFTIRLDSHYVLGIWALEKNSDLPPDPMLGEFVGRGKMPKWDPDWQGIWDALDQPDKTTVHRIWQEASEGVELARADVQAATMLAGKLDPAKYDDLMVRLRHQRWAAEAWRAVKLAIWAHKARTIAPNDVDLPGYVAWARAELFAIKAAMEADGLANVPIASPARIQAFYDSSAGLVPAGTAAVQPAPPAFAAMRTVSVEPSTATIAIGFSAGAQVTVDFGREVPDFGGSIQVDVAAGASKEVVLSALEPGARYVVRLRATLAGVEYMSGYHWVFTPES